jgi:DNA-binding transcriptional ArsR family regulator
VSHEAYDWARRQKVGSTGRKAVLMALAEYADEEHSCFPSQATLAEITEQCERTVRAHLKALESDGLITRRHRPRREGRGRTSDRYVLHVLPAEIAAPTDLPATGDDQPATERVPTGKSFAGEPLENHHSEPDRADRFDDFWAVYPRRVAKGAAKRAWKAAMKRRVDPDRIIHAAKRYRDAPNRDPSFTAHASTWLNSERYDDEDGDVPKEQRRCPGCRRLLNTGEEECRVCA